MTSKSSKSFAKLPNIIFIGFTFGFLAWFLDAAVDTYLFHQGTFMNNIMAPGSEQIWIRSFVVFLMIVFSGIVQAIINKRKSIEAALLVSEERYRRLEAVSAEGILIHDGEKILDVNQTLLDASGYERDELVGRSPLEWLTPESREKAAANIRSGYDEPYELTAVKKDGSTIAIEINARSVEYDEQIVRVASLRLVQEQKKATKIDVGASEKYRNLLYGGNDPLFVYGLSNDGGPDKFVEVNDMACIKFGYTRDEYEKLNMLSMVVPEDRDNISAIFQTLIDFKHSVFETEILTKDDDRIPVEISSHLVEQSGMPIIISSMRETTERRKAEQALRANEKRYRTLFIQAPAAYHILDKDGIIIDVNDKWLELFGHSSDDAVGSWFGDYLERASLDRFNAAFADLKESGGNTEMELDLIRKDGSTVNINLTASTLHRAASDTTITYCIMRDIAERRMNEDEKEKQDELVEFLIDRSDNLICTLALDGTVSNINPAFENVAGKAAIGRKFEALVHPDDATFAEQTISKCALGEKIPPIEVRVQPVSGDCIVVEFSFRTQYKNGKPAGITGTARDLTRRWQQPAAAEEVGGSEILTESLTDAACLIDNDFKIVGCNSDFEKLCTESGTSGDLIGRSITDTKPFNTEKLCHFIDNLIEQGAIGTMEEAVESNSGEFNIEITGIPIFRNEKTSKLLVMCKTVTGSKSIEKGLDESMERLHLAVKNIPGMVCAYDDNDALLIWNRECEEVTGYTAEEMIGNPKVRELIYPDRKYRENIHAESEKKGNFRNWELEVTCKDGTKKIISWSNVSGQYPIPGWASWCIGYDITERIKAEHDLRELASRNKSILEAIPDIIMEVDNNKVYTWANGAGINFFGNDVIGKEASEYFDGEQETYEKVQPLFEGDENTTYVESWQRRHDGEKRLLAWWCRVLKDADGNVTGSLSTARDITAQRNAEEALRHSERKYSELVQESPDAIISLDMSGNFLSFNLMAEKITGLSSDAILGKHFSGIGVLDADSLPVASDEFGRIVNGDERSPFLLTIIDKDKNPVVMDVRARLIKSEGGKMYVQAVLHDITERKQFEDALQNSEEKFRNIVESSVDGIVLVDEKYKIIEWNHGQELITGLSRDEVLGYQIYDIQHQLAIEENRTDEMYKMLKSTMQEIARTGQPPFLNRFIETEIRRSDDSRRIVDMLSFPIKSGNGFMVCTITRDITDKKRADKELTKAEKLESIGVLAGGIAHDFNNILTAILGNISLARMGAQPGSDLFLRLSEAEKASGRAQNLTRQLLTFSKGGTPKKKSIHIIGLINESCGFALHGSNVKAVCNLKDDLCPVFADEGQFSQVMNNLIINANQAMPDGGTIEIEAENISIPQETHLPLKEGQYVKISVKDEGGGIPEQYLKRIFDPYFTTKRKGSGLGLATTYSIIKNHGGHVEVKSRLNKGTTFIIYLPVSQTPPEISHQGDDLLASGNGKILIMDDEEAIRRVTGLALNRLGYKTEFAGDGDEGLRVFRTAFENNEPFDAVILDLTIPGGMGGKEMLDKLREIDPGIKAIVSSGYNNDPIMSDYAEFGFDGVIEKPFKAGELGGIVKQVLSGKKVSV